MCLSPHCKEVVSLRVHFSCSFVTKMNAFSPKWATWRADWATWPAPTRICPAGWSRAKRPSCRWRTGAVSRTRLKYELHQPVQTLLLPSFSPLQISKELVEEKLQTNQMREQFEEETFELKNKVSVGLKGCRGKQKVGEM